MDSEKHFSIRVPHTRQDIITLVQALGPLVAEAGGVLRDNDGLNPSCDEDLPEIVDLTLAMTHQHTLAQPLAELTLNWDDKAVPFCDSRLTEGEVRMQPSGIGNSIIAEGIATVRDFIAMPRDTAGQMRLQHGGEWTAKFYDLTYAAAHVPPQFPRQLDHLRNAEGWMRLLGVLYEDAAAIPEAFQRSVNGQLRRELLPFAFDARNKHTPLHYYPTYRRKLLRRIQEIRSIRSSTNERRSSWGE